MFDSWLGEYYAARAIEAIGKLPKEVIYSAAAVIAVSEVSRRYTNMRTKEAEAEAKVRLEELAVEKLRLQLDLHNAKAGQS